MQVMCLGLGDEVLVRTLWVKSLWSIDSLAGASVSLFSHGIVTWPMIPTSDKKGGSHRCFWNQSSDFGKTVAAKYMKSNLYTLVVGGFGHHCFEQDLLKSLEYSTSCNTQVTLDWTQRRIFSAEVSMVDVNEQAQQAGAACWSGCTCCGGIVGLGLLQKLSFIYLLPHIMEIWLQSSKGKKIYI